MHKRIDESSEDIVMSPGDYFGEQSLTESPLDTTVQAITTVTLLSISARAIKRLINTNEVDLVKSNVIVHLRRKVKKLMPLQPSINKSFSNLSLSSLSVSDTPRLFM